MGNWLRRGKIPLRNFLRRKWVLDLWARFNASPGLIVILHRVVPSTGDPEANPLLRNCSTAITEENLERIIRFFDSRGYDFISLDQMVNRLAGSDKRKKFAVFTFDDGYLDNLLYAYPLLKKYQVPFTVYLTTGLPDRTQCLWWFYLEDWVEAGKPIDFRFSGRHFALSCQNDHEKRQAMTTLSRLLETSPPDTLARFLKEILEPRFGNPMAKTGIFSLSWPQIRLLGQDPLVTIASHGTLHGNCTCLAPDDLADSLYRSRARIEEEIGRKVEHFAYPFGHVGSFDENVTRMVVSAGYRTATTTLHGTLKRKHLRDLFLLPRISMNSKTGPWLELLCSGLPRRYYL